MRPIKYFTAKIKKIILVVETVDVLMGLMFLSEKN